jgi:hypothetical protein
MNSASRFKAHAVAIASLLSSFLLGCSGGGKADLEPPDAARRLLLDRNWLDRLPDGPQDRLHVFRFVPRMGGGVFQDRTLYAGTFELFHFDQDGQRIHFRMPHTGEDVRAQFSIEHLHAPEESSPFELHLHIEGSPRGPLDYYSLRGEGSADLDASLSRAFLSGKKRR